MDVRRMSVVVVVAVLGVWADCAFAQQQQQQQPQPQPQPQQQQPSGAQTRPATRPFTISKETTYYTAPVRDDGTIDYVEAINERLSRGVTPENNAGVPLIDVLSLGAGGRDGHYERVRAKLGIKAAAVKPAPTPDAAEPEGLDAALGGPWTPEKLPAVAKWLDGMNPQLDQVVEASRRTHYYLPLIRERADDSTVAVLLPHLNRTRFVVNALRARAMLRLGTEDMDGFARDALAGVRVARLMTHAATLVEQLVAIGCEAAALDGIRTAAAGGWLSAAQVEQMLAELRGTPSAPLWETFELGERVFMLEFLQLAAVRGMAEASKMLRAMAGGVQAGPVDNAPPAAARVDASGKDWDAAMRKVNRWYERLAGAGKLPIYRDRMRESDAIMREVAEMKVRLEGWRGMFAPLEDRMLVLAFPSMNRAYTTQAKLEADRALTEAALALSSFRGKAGEYPASLRELVPGYFKAEPMDPFTNRPLEYRPEAGGYLLRSVGENGKVDAGEKSDDRVVRAER